MKVKDFNEFEKRILPEVAGLLKALKKDIQDDFRASDDPADDTPAMQITLSTNEELSQWSYQTGDNSFSGSCYGDPYWGIGVLTRDSNPEEVAKELVNDLGEQIEFED